MLPNIINGLDYLATTIVWKIPVGGGVRQVKLDHTFVGRRVELFLDGKIQLDHTSEIKKKPEKFPFKIGSMECATLITKTDNVFGYSIQIDGKPLPVYKTEHQKKFDTWLPKIGGVDYRVVLDKEYLELYGNGEKIDNDRHFIDNGGVTNFTLADAPCRIEARKTEKSITNTFYSPEGLVPLDTNQNPETYKFDAERFFNSCYVHMG